MPKEVVTNQGVIYQSTADDKLRENDQILLAMIYSLLSMDKKEAIKEYLDSNYLAYLDRKVERVKVIKEKGVINLSDPNRNKS